MRYIDAFVVPVSKRNLAAYIRMAKWGKRIWMEHGAIEYHEAVGHDLNMPFGMPFPKMARLKAGETVFFSWIVYKSRAHRNRVAAKVMKDPRMNEMGAKKMPFDVKRMACGGFEIKVSASR